MYATNSNEPLLYIPKQTYFRNPKRSTSVWGLANELDLTMSATNRTASNCQKEEEEEEEEEKEEEAEEEEEEEEEPVKSPSTRRRATRK